MVATLLSIFASFNRSQVKMSDQKEVSFIMVKPDGVQRGLVGEIIKRFESRGFQLIGCKMMSPSKEFLETHYQDLKSKAFFPGLIKYMSSGPVVAMAWQGKSVVKTGRVMLGATNPLDSNPGTIRGDFCIDVGRNICHGSDSVESGKREVELWFGGKTEEYSLCTESMIYE
ncbi:nucleoside diphosphate kinase A-like [Ylistrum balloti]|uniref:nucleoside diphosphate kinase A-like n=1 Tax=Ylistrum balloti TaxID=509963 RepID=UPI002905B277|nr:nucleoside diphosphate kinase A-like [Ylistrum balloti]